MASLGIGFIGSLIRLVAYVGNEHNFIALAVGQALIGVGTISMILQLAVTDNSWSLSAFMATMPAGYLISQLLNQIIFTRENAYLTHIEESAWKIEIYMSLQAFFIMVSLISALMQSRKYEDISMVEVIEIPTGFKDGISVLFKTNKNSLFIIIGFAFMYGAFFLHL